jgi:hypothetical protein
MGESTIFNMLENGSVLISRASGIEFAYEGGYMGLIKLCDYALRDSPRFQLSHWEGWIVVQWLENGEVVFAERFWIL